MHHVTRLLSHSAMPFITFNVLTFSELSLPYHMMSSYFQVEHCISYEKRLMQTSLYCLGFRIISLVKFYVYKALNLLQIYDIYCMYFPNFGTMVAFLVFI